jgi:hypothetical protein
MVVGVGGRHALSRFLRPAHILVAHPRAVVHRPLRGWRVAGLETGGGVSVLRRAVGEVTMIVIGVLIALAASDWQQRRLERTTELDMLRELSTQLEEDLVVLEGLLARYVNIENRVGTLLTVLRSDAPYADSLDLYFGTLYGMDGTPLNTSGYESLKSQGLGLIEDDALRSHIARVYETSYTRARGAIDDERSTVLDLLRPYFLMHFRDLRFNESATPLDYDLISNDPEFLNLADYRLQNLTQNGIPLMRGAIPEIRALKVAIDQALTG